MSRNFAGARENPVGARKIVWKRAFRQFWAMKMAAAAGGIIPAYGQE